MSEPTSLPDMNEEIPRTYADPVEVAARAIAKQNGDELEALPRHKSDWIAQRGHFGGRFRDVNEPMQGDYEDMAEAALDALRKRGFLSSHYFDAVQNLKGKENAQAK